MRDMVCSARTLGLLIPAKLKQGRPAGQLTPLADRESAAVHECTADASEGQKEVETHETEVTPNESLRSL